MSADISYVTRTIFVGRQYRLTNIGNLTSAYHARSTLHSAPPNIRPAPLHFRSAHMLWGTSLTVPKCLGPEASWVRSILTGMTIYCIGPHQTTSDYIGPHRITSDQIWLNCSTSAPAIHQSMWAEHEWRKSRSMLQTISVIKPHSVHAPRSAPLFFCNSCSLLCSTPPDFRLAPRSAPTINFRISRTNGGQINHAIYR